MADYTDNVDGLEEEGGKKKKTTVIIVVLIILIWLAIFVMMVKLDAFGFGSTVMYPAFKNVPVLNMILPESPESSAISSNSGDTYTTLQEAINRINQLESDLAIYKTNADTNAEQISSLTAEVSRLKEYEKNQTTYEAQKKKFDEDIVYTDHAPDLIEYANWYEKMDPENAANIYREVQEELAIEQVVQDLADYYAAMKPASAARVFEEMTGDLEKIATILSAMTADSASDILAAMNPTLAAKLTLLIYPAEYEPSHDGGKFNTDNLRKDEK